MLLRPKLIRIKQESKDTKDIYYVAYNSFYRDHKALFHVMKLQENYICKPSFDKKSICIQLTYTYVNNELMNRLLDQIEKCKDHLDKVAIVGVPVNERAYFTLKAKYKGSNLPPCQFFFNVDAANNWLHK